MIQTLYQMKATCDNCGKQQGYLGTWQGQLPEGWKFDYKYNMEEKKHRAHWCEECKP